MRTALAKGADRAVHIEIDDAGAENLEPIHVAKALAKYAKNNKFDAVFVGKQVSIIKLKNTLSVTYTCIFFDYIRFYSAKISIIIIVIKFIILVFLNSLNFKVFFCI